VTPEYNYPIPGVLKNAADWASRPPSTFDGKPIGIMGASGEPAGGDDPAGEEQVRRRRQAGGSADARLRRPRIWLRSRPGCCG
jgi:chromate reductase